RAPPGNLPATEAQFVQSLQWWRDNYSHALDHKTTKQFVDKASAQAVEYARSLPQKPGPSRQAPRVVQPSPAPSASTGMGAPTSSSRSREDGPSSSSSRRGKRGRAPSPTGTPGEVQPRRSRQASQEPRSSDSDRQTPFSPSPQLPQAIPKKDQPPCIFCSNRGHYSAECHYRKRLSERASILRDIKVRSTKWARTDDEDGQVQSTKMGTWQTTTTTILFYNIVKSINILLRHIKLLFRVRWFRWSISPMVNDEWKVEDSGAIL
ncbi:hypothetical protein COOONC_26011, partial [Cooperia oncophora]